MNIYGASGHAKVILDIAKSQDILVELIYDDNPEVKELAGYKVIHEFTSDFMRNPTVLAIGNNRIRKKLARNFSGKFLSAFAHKTAEISPSANISEGTVVMANAAVNNAADIGRHCIINTGAVVEHDCRLEDFVHISPNATVTGEVIIGEGSQIGAGAVVIPGIKIGRWVTIGAGAVIREDVPDFATVVGNPGRIIKYSDENYD